MENESECLGDVISPQYKVLVPREGLVSDLYKAMEEASGLAKERMMLVELSSSIVSTSYVDLREGNSII